MFGISTLDDANQAPSGRFRPSIITRPVLVFTAHLCILIMHTWHCPKCHSMDRVNTRNPGWRKRKGGGGPSVWQVLEQISWATELTRHVSDRTGPPRSYRSTRRSNLPICLGAFRLQRTRTGSPRWFIARPYIYFCRLDPVDKDGHPTHRCESYIALEPDNGHNLFFFYQVYIVIRILRGVRTKAESARCDIIGPPGRWHVPPPVSRSIYAHHFTLAARCRWEMAVHGAINGMKNLACAATTPPPRTY